MKSSNIKFRERCGIIVNNDFYEIKNVSDNPYEFLMDPEEFYDKLKRGKLEAIVHTHYEDCTPSMSDLQNMKIWKVYWIIISRKCIKVYRYSSDFGVVEIDINTLSFKELNNFFMKLLH